MTVATIDLRPGYTISRVICGGWQLAGGHGPVDRSGAVADLAAFAEAGITTKPPRDAKSSKTDQVDPAEF